MNAKEQLEILQEAQKIIDRKKRRNRGLWIAFGLSVFVGIVEYVALRISSSKSE